MKINSIVFDLDGPILDGRERHYRCYSDILLENGFTPLPIDAYWAMKRKAEDRHKQLALSGAGSIYDIFLRDWIERIEKKKYLSLDQLQPGALEKLEEWKMAGIRLYLVTMRNHADSLMWQMQRLNLQPFFEEIIAVGTERGNNGKAEEIGTRFTETEKLSALWIGDTEVDIMAARMLEIKVCAVTCGLRSAECLALHNPDFLVPDIMTLELEVLQ